eukprot:jgi/Tetstr1/430587/TSEL_020384.t1
MYKQHGAERRVLQRDGLNTRDLDKLAETTISRIVIWVRVGDVLFKRHCAEPPRVNGRSNTFHFLMSRVDHVELLEPGDVSAADRRIMEQRFDLVHVDTATLRAIADKSDENTADDLVFVLGGKTAALNSANARLGMRPQDVILQAGTNIYKHEDTRDLDGRMSTCLAHDHHRELKTILQNNNVRPMLESMDRRAYRAMCLADQVWGHTLDLSLLPTGQTDIYTSDFRKVYGAEFSSVESFPYFHGYPAFHEFEGPIGNAPGCTAFRFGSDRVAVFKIHSMDTSGMDARLRATLWKAGLFKDEFATTYLCSPIVHWLQDRGVAWRAECAWVSSCVSATWCPADEAGADLYSRMISERTYPIVMGLLQAGRKALKSCSDLAPNRGQARNIATMFKQEFTNEASMRMAGLDRFVRGEELVTSTRTREQMQRLVDDARLAQADKKSRSPGHRNKQMRLAAANPAQLDIRAVFGRAAANAHLQEQEPAPPRGEEPPPGALYLHSTADAMVEPTNTPNVVIPTMVGNDGDSDTPHTAITTTARYGNRVGHDYISTFQHAYCVTRMLQAIDCVRDKSLILGYSLDAIHTLQPCDSDFAAAGLLETDTPTSGMMKPAETTPASDKRGIRQECLLSNHVVDGHAERVMEEVDASLAPDPERTRWSEERNAYQQINVVTGRPGTGKTTGLFVRHAGSADLRLPRKTTVLATPTNLLACDFGNKFKGVKAKTFHKTLRVPVFGELEAADSVFNSYKMKREGDTRSAWSSIREGDSFGIANRQTVVLDESSQHLSHHVQYAIDVAKANHLQLFISIDYDETTGRIYQMGPVEVIPGLSLAPKAIMAQQPPLHHIRRSTVHRQTGDDELDTLLESLREGTDLAGIRSLLDCPFLEEFGLDPADNSRIYKGMLASVTKREWLDVFEDSRFHSQEDPEDGEQQQQRRPGALVYDNKNYSASKQSVTNAATPNKINPLIASTAHTVQGREVNADGAVFLLLSDKQRGYGGWTEDFALNSVYVTATRVRRRDQLRVVFVDDIIN